MIKKYIYIYRNKTEDLFFSCILVVNLAHIFLQTGQKSNEDSEGTMPFLVTLVQHLKGPQCC